MTDSLTPRFDLQTLLGEGGMGQVWRAIDRVTGHIVALKRSAAREAEADALRGEFWWLRRLQGEHLVQAHDFGLDADGWPWYSMELLDGGAAEALPLPPEEALDLARHACRALRRLHAEGLVHGDVSRRNVRRGADGAWRLMDLGLLSPVGQRGAVRGTPDYMAPEVIQGAPLDGRADLYALGAVLHHLLTGVPPFQVGTTAALLRAHLEDPPPRPSARRPGLPPLWDRLLPRLLAKAPGQRPASVAEVLAELGDPVEPGPAPLLTAPFVGREGELAWFDDALGGLSLGRTGAAWRLEGQPGVGKSRLLDVFAARAQLAATRVLRAGCRGAGAPYHPFVGLLHQAWPWLEAEEPRLLEGHAAALSLLVPELVQAPSRHALEPRAAQLRAVTALVELLVALVQRGGLVVLLDDWHLADGPSREVLAALLRHVQGEAMLLVVATDADGAEAVLPGLPGLRLQPLGRREVARLAGAVFGGAHVPGPFVEQLAELSGGVPQRVDALLTHWAAAGVIPQVEGRWVLDVLPSEVVAGVQAATLDGRLASLGDAERTLLARLAVARAPVAPATLAGLTADLPDAARFEALATLERARLVGRLEAGFAVVQRHLTEAWLASLPPQARLHAHRRWAEALVELHPKLPALAREQALRPEFSSLDGGALSGEVLVELAGHLVALGGEADAAERVPVVLAAARHLAGLYDLAAAAELAGHALAWLRQGDAGASWPVVGLPVWRCAAAVLLADVARFQGELAVAGRTYEEALATPEAVEALPLRVRGLIGLALVAQSEGQHVRALGHLREALPLARGLAEAREELRCLAAMGRLHYQLGERTRAALVYEEALARAEAVDDAVYMGESLAFLGYLDVSEEASEAGPPPTERGVARLREAIDLQGLVGDPLGLNDSHMLLGNALYHLGDLPGAAHAFGRNRTLCRELGFFEEATACLNLALVALARGELAEAFDLAHVAQGMARERADAFIEDLALALEARVWVALGSPGRGWRMAEVTLQRRIEAEDDYGQLFAGLAVVEAALELGLDAEAEGMALELLATQAHSGLTEFSLPLAWGTGRLAARRQQLEVARVKLEEALARASQRGAAWWVAQLCLSLGELRLEAGDADEARPWLARAEEAARACEARALLLQALFFMARLERLGGQAMEADRLLQHAQELATPLGMRLWQARIAHERSLAQFPSPRAGRWVREARGLLQPLVDELEPALRPAFLALDGRAAMLGGGFQDEPGGGPGPEARPAGPGAIELEGPQPAAVSQLRTELDRQRRWFGELQRTAERLQTQLDFAQALQALDGEEAIIQAALELVLDVVGASRADFLAFEGLRLVARASRVSPHLPPVDEDWTFHAERVVEASHAGTVWYAPVHEDPVVGRRAVLALPLGDARERWGLVLALGHPDAAPPLEPGDLDSLRLLAGTLLAALRRSRLEAEWRAKTHRLEMLYRLASKVTSTLVMEEVLDLVLQLSLEVTQAERGCVFLVDEAGALRGEAAATRDAEGAAGLTNGSFSQSILRRVHEGGEALWVEDTQDDAEFRHQQSIQDLNLRSVLAVPLAIHQRVIGVLYVDSRVVVRAFTALELDTLRAIASHAAVALENARLYELATVDRLTRLYFRSHFERRLREELRRLDRAEGTLALLMMDIDHFKRFNDTYGHAVGDQVLAHVAGLIRANVRQDIDVPCRYGGEEMVVLLPDTDANGAAVFAERVRRAIDETPLGSDAHGPLHVTISIGTATAPADARDGLSLMELADRALYASKRGGRNRVTAWVEGTGA